jgi:prepilin-type processing-associated H-X9-DG protein
MYMGDYDGVTMRWRRYSYSDEATYLYRSMPALLTPYIKNDQIWFCPSANTTSRGLSYHVNVAALANGGMQDPINGVETYTSTEEAALNSAMTAICWDGSVVSTEDWTWTWYSSREPDTAYYGLSRRHSDGANVAYYDGHVKYVPFRRLWLTNAGADIPMTMQPGNRAVVGPNPFFTAAGES